MKALKTAAIRWVLSSLLTAQVSCSREEQIQDAERECGNIPFEEIKKQDQISDSCRDAVIPLLPYSATNVESRSLVLSDKIVGDDRELIVAFTNESGGPMELADILDMRVSLEEGGKIDQLEAGDFTVSALAEVDSGAPLLALSFVSDYSASMRDRDLEISGEMYSDLATILGGFSVADVSIFSSTVKKRQDFTDDLTQVLQTLKVDPNFARESTALLDGMGEAGERLAARANAAKIQLVATDGSENASTEWTAAELIDQQNSSGHLTIMMGSLFADLDEMKSLIGSSGVYVYASEISRLKEYAFNLNRALGRSVQLVIPKDSAKVNVTIGETVYTIFEP
jgi:hypothetical protein